MLQVPAELFGLSAEPVLLVRNGRVLYANNAACRLFSAVSSLLSRWTRP